MDNALIFGSISFWECTEAVFWLNQTNYQGYLGIDVKGDAVNQSMENALFMSDFVGSLNTGVLKKLLAEGDANGAQRMLWRNLTNPRRA